MKKDKKELFIFNIKKREKQNKILLFCKNKNNENKLIIIENFRNFLYVKIRKNEEIKKFKSNDITFEKVKKRLFNYFNEEEEYLKYYYSNQQNKLIILANYKENLNYESEISVIQRFSILTGISIGKIISYKSKSKCLNYDDFIQNFEIINDSSWIPNLRISSFFTFVKTNPECNPFKYKNELNKSENEKFNSSIHTICLSFIDYDELCFIKNSIKYIIITWDELDIIKESFDYQIIKLKNEKELIEKFFFYLKENSDCILGFRLNKDEDENTLTFIKKRYKEINKKKWNDPNFHLIELDIEKYFIESKEKKIIDIYSLYYDHTKGNTVIKLSYHYMNEITKINDSLIKVLMDNSKISLILNNINHIIEDFLSHCKYTLNNGYIEDEELKSFERIIINLLSRYFIENNLNYIIGGPEVYNHDEKSCSGGKVFIIKKTNQVYENVINIDIKSCYPNMAILHQLCPSTIKFDETTTFSLKKMNNMKDNNNSNNNSNRNNFREIELTDVKKENFILDTRMKKNIQHGENLRVKISETEPIYPKLFQNLILLRKEISKKNNLWNNIQQQKIKTILNSTIGYYNHFKQVFLNFSKKNHNKLYNPEFFSLITFYARETIGKLKNILIDAKYEILLLDTDGILIKSHTNLKCECEDELNKEIEKIKLLIKDMGKIEIKFNAIKSIIIHNSKNRTILNFDGTFEYRGTPGTDIRKPFIINWLYKYTINKILKNERDTINFTIIEQCWKDFFVFNDSELIKFNWFIRYFTNKNKNKNNNDNWGGNVNGNGNGNMELDNTPKVDQLIILTDLIMDHGRSNIIRGYNTKNIIMPPIFCGGLKVDFDYYREEVNKFGEFLRELNIEEEKIKSFLNNINNVTIVLKKRFKRRTIDDYYPEFDSNFSPMFRDVEDLKKKEFDTSDPCSKCSNLNNYCNNWSCPIYLNKNYKKNFY
jgi:DNA polymerase elongation subunit (family B)